MPNTEILRLARDAPADKVIAAVNGLADVVLGNLGGQVRLDGHDGSRRDANTGAVVSSGEYQLIVRSAGGSHGRFRHSSGTPDMLLVHDSGVTVQTLTANGPATFNALATFNAGISVAGTTDLKGPLILIGDAASDNLTVTATSTFASPVQVNASLNVTGTPITLGDAAGDVLTVHATATFNPLATFAAGLTANGPVTANAAVTVNGSPTVIGDAAADVLTVNATSTFAALSTFAAGLTVGGTIATSPVTVYGVPRFLAPQSAVCSSALSLTTSMQNIAGCVLNIAAGQYLVTGTYDFSGPGAGDVGSIAIGGLAVASGSATIATATSQALFLFTAATSRATVVQTWVVTATAAAQLTLQASKTGGSGTSVAQVTHTKITVVSV